VEKGTINVGESERECVREEAKEREREREREIIME
jgi:hypothetical protein